MHDDSHASTEALNPTPERLPLKKGLVGPKNEQGIKKLISPMRGFTHELKIHNSANRILGRINDEGILVFSEYAAGGLH